MGGRINFGTFGKRANNICLPRRTSVRNITSVITTMSLSPWTTINGRRRTESLSSSYQYVRVGEHRRRIILSSSTAAHGNHLLPLLPLFHKLGRGSLLCSPPFGRLLQRTCVILLVHLFKRFSEDMESVCAEEGRGL